MNNLGLVSRKISQKDYENKNKSTMKIKVTKARKKTYFNLTIIIEYLTLY